MREIKFRYYDPSIKCMLSPSCVGEYGFYAEDRDFEDGRSMPFEKLMQFTGLKDKNGKEIFEGDLLRYPGDPEHFTAYEVFFHDGDANSSYDIGYCLARTHNQG